MLTLKLEIEAKSEDEMTLMLERVTGLVAEGYTSGEGWQITGSEELPDEDDEDT